MLMLLSIFIQFRSTRNVPYLLFILRLFTMFACLPARAAVDYSLNIVNAPNKVVNYMDAVVSWVLHLFPQCELVE
jgi:hypothetical protein